MVRRDVGEMLSRFDHLGGKSIVECLNDRRVELAGVVPHLLEDARQNRVAPLLSSHESGAAIEVEDPDHVWILGRIGRYGRYRSCVRLLLGCADRNVAFRGYVG